MANSGRNHLLQLALSLGKLVLEVMGPIPEKDHRTRVVIILDINDVQAHHIMFFGIRSIFLVLGNVSIRVNNAVETVRLSPDQGCLNVYWLFLVYRVRD